MSVTIVISNEADGRHCKEHVGIASLAGIDSKDLKEAVGRAIDLERDVSKQYIFEVEDIILKITVRGRNIMTFKVAFEAIDLLMGDNERFIEDMTAQISQDLKLFNWTEKTPHEFKSVVEQAFLDNTLDACNKLKKDISSSLDTVRS